MTRCILSLLAVSMALQNMGSLTASAFKPRANECSRPRSEINTLPKINISHLTSPGELLISPAISLRGGQQRLRCMKYTTIGLINLTAQRSYTQSGQRTIKVSSNNNNMEDDENIIVHAAVDEWIESQYQSDLGLEQNLVGTGNIITIPSSTNDEASGRNSDITEGSFAEDEDIGSVVETIGALTDVIVVLYDTSNASRHKSIIRLLKGIERQKETTQKENSISVVILANEKEAVVELNSILDVLKDDGLGDTIQVIPMATGRGSGGDLRAQYGPGVHDALTKTSNMNAMYNSEVPMGIFPRLVGRVYSKLCGDGSESTVSFDSIIVEKEEFEDTQYEVNSADEYEYDQIDENECVEKDLEFEDSNTRYKTSPPDDILERSQEDESDDYVDLDKNTQVKQPPPIPKREPTPPVVPTGPSKILEIKVTRRCQRVLVDCERQLRDLEMKQDEVLLASESKMPILEFGRDANDILVHGWNAFDEREIQNNIATDIDLEYVDEKRRDVFVEVNANVQRLFENQMQSLREFYGRRYESVIDRFQMDGALDDPDLDREEYMNKRRERDSMLTEEAKRATEGFRTAATNAIPAILKKADKKEFIMRYNFEVALDGLIRDLMHATSSMQSLEEDWDDVHAEADEGPEDGLPMNGGRKRPVTWYEKLGARALVFAVNYLQGWLAYQGIRKAAAERDKDMPKFPLF